MIARRVVVEGRVQGVGFRAWVAGAARATGLNGFVRNRTDGSVECVFYGDEATVNEMVEACRHGPRHAVVTKMTSDACTAEPWTGFEVRPTA